MVAIYNVRLDVVQHSMKSHDAAVTGAACCCCARRRGDGHMSNGSNGSLCAGLAFVGNGKHLVSAGRDASVCFWSPSADSGEKFIAERMARLQPAYEGSTAPHAGSPVLVRGNPPSLLCIRTIPTGTGHTPDASATLPLSLTDECRYKDTAAATVCWCTIQSSLPSTVLRQLCVRPCGPRATNQLSRSSMWSLPPSLQTAGT